MKNIENELMSFLLGILVGMLIVVAIAASSEHNVESLKPIKPEIMLTTDGKTIDTMYIYKQR
jgi:hypothetical protein